MKRPSAWIAGFLFGAIGLSAHWSPPAQSTSDVTKRVIAPPGPKPVGPYSPGIMAGDFLYVSGQGARDRDGKLPETVDAQVRQTLENVKTIVEAAGLTLQHVVYSQVYLASMSSYDTMDRIWREYFPKQPPARAVLGVHRMPTDTPVEINVVAFRDLSRRKAIVPAGYPPNSPATAGVMAGDRLYLSGSFGAEILSGSVPADPAAQVQLALDNMKQTLTAAGMDFRHVVFVNPYLTDQASGQMNAIYAKHFEFGNTPARATIRVASLPGGNTIEFTGVAVAIFRNASRFGRRICVRAPPPAPVCLPAIRTSVRRRGRSRRDPTKCRASMLRPSRRRYGSRCGTSSMASRRPG